MKPESTISLTDLAIMVPRYDGEILVSAHPMSLFLDDTDKDVLVSSPTAHGAELSAADCLRSELTAWLYSES